MVFGQLVKYHPAPWLRWPNVSWHQSRSPKSRTKFLEIFFTLICWSDSWTYVSPISGPNLTQNLDRIWPESDPGPWSIFLDPNYNASIVNLSWIYRESIENLSGTCPRCQQLFPVWKIKSMEIMKIGLKWVHMGRYGVILRLDGALWHTIIPGPLLTPKGAIKIQKIKKKS